MSYVFSTFLYHLLCIPSVQILLFYSNGMALCSRIFYNPNVVHNLCTLDYQPLLPDVSFLLTSQPLMSAPQLGQNGGFQSAHISASKFLNLSSPHTGHLPFVLAHRPFFRSGSCRALIAATKNSPCSVYSPSPFE